MHSPDYLEEHGLTDFRHVHRTGTDILVRTGYEEHVGVFVNPDATRAVEWTSGGRVPHAVISLPGGERVVVRQYMRGGFVRHFNRKRYFLGHRSFAELAATEQASRGGASVPVVLAAVENRGAFGYVALLATRWIDRIRQSVDVFASPSSDGRSSTLTAVGEQIGLVHRAGVGHPDLNLRNIFVSQITGKVTILDFDRAKLFSGPVPASRRKQDILRFARSATKLGTPLSSGDWAAIAAGYGPEWPLSEGRG